MASINTPLSHFHKMMATEDEFGRDISFGEKKYFVLVIFVKRQF